LFFDTELVFFEAIFESKTRVTEHAFCQGATSQSGFTKEGLQQ